MKRKSRNPKFEKLVTDSPRAGVYYYVWLKPRWKLFGAFDTSHLEIWNNEIVNVIGAHYRLSGDERIDLQSMFHSMPRGRVGIRGGVPFLWHGADTKQDVLDAVVSTFGLTESLLRGELHVVDHLHEHMNEEHKEVIQEIIGKVPYPLG